LTTWLWTALTAEGLPMVCLDARHAKKALDMKVNKTDANDAEGLAHLVRAGWYREVSDPDPFAAGRFHKCARILARSERAYKSRRTHGRVCALLFAAHQLAQFCSRSS
jgi:transposase